MKVGIAGLHRGQSFLRVFGNRDDCQIKTVCDVSTATLDQVATEWGIEKRVSDFDALIDSGIDAVVIATPGPLHARQAIRALDADLHVLSEVPAAWSIEECHQLVKAAQSSKAEYMLAENMCYFHYLMQWRKRIQAGEIGKVTYAEAEYVHDISPRMRQGNWRQDMPPLYYGTHSLGPILDILEDQCTQAIGLSTGSRTNPDVGAHDLEVGLYRTTGDVPIKILCGFSICREPAFHWQVFYGTEGVIENGRPPGDSAKMFVHGDTSMRKIPADVSDPGVASAVTGGHGTSETLLVDDFVRGARGEHPIPIDVYRGVEMTAPGICAHDSALMGGQPVEVPDFRPAKD